MKKIIVDPNDFVGKIRIDEDGTFVLLIQEKKELKNQTRYYVGTLEITEKALEKAEVTNG